MRLAHVVDEPYDSGIVHYALSAARALKDAGHEVEVWARPDGFPLKEAERMGLRARLLGGVAQLWALRRGVAGIQVINAHTGSSHTLALAVARSVSGGPRVVRTRADARPVRKGPASPVLWSRTAGFIAPTLSILEQFRAVFKDFTGEAAAVYPGFPDAPPAPEPAGDLRIGIVGRLDPVKGHADFLRAAAEAAQKFPGAKFLIAGREENVKRGRLEALLSNLGLRGRAEILGHVPDAAAFMRGCHLGVVASTGSEAVSRVAVEWMAAGRALVATSVGCLPEYVGDRKAGLLVPPGDPKAMGAAIVEVLGDAKARARLAAAGRKRFETAFGMRRLAKETEELYERTLRAVPSR